MPAVLGGHLVGDVEGLDFPDHILLKTPLGLWDRNASGME